MPICDQLAAVDRGYAEGEAALAVAAFAPAHAAGILDVLGLTEASYHWDAARVAAVVLERCRHGRVFSANTIRAHVPARAVLLIAPAFTWLRKERLIAPTGTKLPAVAPGARCRKVRCYTLTLAGERVSRNLAPVPGMDAWPMPDLNRMSA